MKVSLGDKAQRVLKMMLGLRNARTAAAMAGFGFTDADLQEGWELLRGVSRAKLDVPSAAAFNSDTIAKLDAWENKWFPISEATVERRFPAVHAQLFNNLSQTTGPAVAVSVRTFVERYDAMAAGTGSYGSEGPATKTLLDQRGLTASVINEARALLETVSKTDSTLSIQTIEQDKEQLAKMEAALWAWYLEWSRIARIAIPQRALLKQMGFGASKTRSNAEPDDDTDVNPVTGQVTSVHANGHIS